MRLQWLRQHTPSGQDDPGFKWVERMLERDRRKGDRQLRRALDQDFAVTVGQLRPRLRHYRVTYALGETTTLPPAREFVSRTLDAMAVTLAEILVAPRTLGDTDALHQARVAAKRLRYTLEPLVEGSFTPVRMLRTTTATIAQLRVLQDELGQLHDALTFDRWLGDRIGEEAARRARQLEAPSGAPESVEPPDERSPDPALSEFINLLRRRLREQTATSYGLLDGARRRRQTAQLIHRVHAVADRLARRRRNDHPATRESRGD